MSNRHSYDIADGHGLRHDPLKAIVAPRPIGWISTLSRDGVPNLAPYSFFNLIHDRPPMLMFCSTGYKDTVRNVEATGEFVFNLATRPLAEQMNLTCMMLPPDVDEFKFSGLESASSTRVRPARVAASPAAFECRAVETRQLRNIEGDLVDGWLTIGQIIHVTLDPSCIVDGEFCTELAHPILRAGYVTDYWEISDIGKFAMTRPQV